MFNLPKLGPAGEFNEQGPVLVSSHPTGAGRHSSNFTGLSSSVSLVEMLGLELRPT